MKKHSIIRTEQLILRDFTSSDVSFIQKLAGDFNIADNTLSVPHTYETGIAEQWIKDIRNDLNPN
ncbi:MAG TPA: hypothetical protein VKA34_08165 [Balneolales bacterium]|nr:hypothetical protein [Balneolales bacterium]